MPTSLRKTDHATALLAQANDATLFLSKDGEPCASFPESVEHRTVVPLRSAGFRDWLTARFYKQYQTAPSAAAFRAVLRTLEARARYEEFPIQRVTQRLGFEGDPYLPTKIILDLANSSGDVLEITSRGWTLNNNLRTAFRQSTSTLPCQSPAPSPQSLAPSPWPPSATFSTFPPTTRGIGRSRGSPPPSAPPVPTPSWSSTDPPAAENPCSPAHSAH